MKQRLTGRLGLRAGAEHNFVRSRTPERTVPAVGGERGFGVAHRRTGTGRGRLTCVAASRACTSRIRNDSRPRPAVQKNRASAPGHSPGRAASDAMTAGSRTCGRVTWPRARTRGSLPCFPGAARRGRRSPGPGRIRSVCLSVQAEEIDASVSTAGAGAWESPFLVYDFLHAAPLLPGFSSSRHSPRSTLPVLPLSASRCVGQVPSVIVLC